MSTNKSIRIAQTARDSLITCRNSQGVEVRASPLRMTRHLVVFEVYNPFSIVQLSEVLNPFQILVNDRLIYSGRAVVSSLVNTGILLVCEVSVDETAWLDVEVFSPTGQRQQLMGDFEAFLAETRKIHSVRPEFKVVVADMQTLFTDLRHWLEQVELGIRSAPSGDRALLEREVMTELSQPVLPAMDELFGRLEVVARELDPTLQPMHRTYIKRQLHPLVLCSPFAFRTFQKPLGYAGDYEMVNMILRDSLEGASLFAKMVNHYFLNSSPALAHRNRINYLIQVLREEARRVTATGRPLRVLNLGCGPAGEVQELLATDELSDEMDLTLLDFNDETIEFTSGRLAELKTRHHRRTPIRFVKKSVHQLLKDGTRLSPDQPKYDLIYCAGLFDYLSNRVCQRLMNIFHDMVSPEGLLVATNVDPSNPARFGMEFLLDWHLTYRDSQQMKLLHPSGVAAENIVTKSDDTGVNIYLEVRRSLGGDPALEKDPEFQAAFAVEDRRERLRIGKLGCTLVIVLMPLGVLLDYAVYPKYAPVFLGLRLLCSLLTAGLLALHFRPWGESHVFWLGLPIALLPASFITLMIALTQGYQSPYYAGLNLVLIAVNVVARWSVAESLGITGSIIVIYALACLPGVLGTGVVFWPDLFNNLYFLALTGVIVVAGNALYNQLRLREFALRFKLKRNQALLEENNRKLRELDETKSRFFANISHELRTPLTLLLAPLEALRHPLARLPESEIVGHLETMHTNGLRLLKRINDLLDLVRLDSGRMEIQRDPVPIPEFVIGIVNSARKLAEDRHLRLDTQVDESLGEVAVDRDKIEKAFLNLLVNAIKFTPSGGTVTCRAFRDENHLILQVSDTGIGIPPEQMSQVFDRFWQADTSARRKYQGVGIGLALVKELVEIQGGTVGVDSIVNQGSTFTLRLPWLESEPADEVVSAPLSRNVVPSPDEAWLASLYRRADLFPSLTSLKDSIRPVESINQGGLPRILIADDEPDMLRFLKSQLSPHFQVLEAVDGLQAIEKAAQFLPEIILCDMMMPERDGLQVCRELRSRTTTRHIPLVLLTARADEETKLAGLQAGANDFMAKPFSGIELHIRLKNLVESHRLQRDLARQKQILEATIEQLKETEMQLVQSEKMASLGRLSAGVIHEINNPLNYAKTGLVVLGRQGRHMPENARANFEEVVRDINEGVDRVVRIVSDLRTFSHPGDGGTEEVEIAETATAALRFLSAEWRAGVTVENTIPSDFTVHASSGKLLQVLINLLQNSLDALSAKEFAPGETPTIRLDAREVSGRKLVSVWDNGTGIAGPDLDKIFDPFFTTKDVGLGTGLGLSLCYRMVAEWGGHILVNTEEGRYCEFVLEFGAPVKSPEFEFQS